MKIISILLAFVFTTLKLLGQVPMDNLEVWYNADSIESNSTKISLLYDMSNKNNNATQTIEENKPILVEQSLNNYPAILFSGNNWLTVELDSEISQPLTAFVLWKKTHSSQPQNVFDNFNPPTFVLAYFSNGIGLYGSQNFKYNKEVVFDYILSKAVFNNSDSKLYENSVLKATGSFGTNGFNGLTIGANSTYQNGLKGNIAELLIYSGVLSQNESDSVENYIYNKYAKKLELGTDLSIDYFFCDTLLFIDSTFTNILWSTGETNDSIYVSEAGGYRVQAQDIFGRMQYDTIWVTYPNPNFSDTTICLGDSVAYAVDLPGSYNYLWSQGSIDSLIWIKEEGLYSVQLTDTNGCSKSFDFFVNVDSFQNLVDLGPDLELCSGNSIGLISGAELVSDYFWTPEGNTDSIQVVNTTGWQSVLLENPIGCVTSDSIYVTITGTAPTPAYSVANLCFGELTTFADESTSPETIVERRWVFNASDTLYGTIVDYQFANPGSQNVELQVTSESGCANSLFFQVTIKPIPEVNYNYTPVCVGVEMNFISDIVLPDGTTITGYNWLLDDNSIGTEQHLDYTFMETGSYVLELIVDTDNGCFNQFTDHITVENNYPLAENISLVAPVNGTIINPSNEQPLFTWNKDNNAYLYVFQLAGDSDFSNILIEDTLQTNSFETNIPYTHDTLHWRVIAYNSCLVSYPSESRFITKVNPTAIEDLLIWLCADSVEIVDGSVHKWYDQSGNNFNPIQSNINYRPQKIDNILAEKPIIRFDDTDRLKYQFTNEYLQPITTFVIWNKTNPTQPQNILDNYTTDPFVLAYFSNGIGLYGSSNFNYLKNETFNFILSTAIFNFTESKIYENSTLKSIGNFGQNSLNGITIGCNYSNENGLKGDIAEIIIYNSLLNVNERICIHQYLRHKYSPPVNLGFDIDVPYGFCDTTITTAEKPWFTDYLWSTGDTTPTISTNHNGEYTVTVTDIFGFTSTDDIRVNFPRVTQEDAISMVCDGDTLIWDSGLPSDGYSFNWLNSSSTDTFATYWQNQQAALQVTDTNGCSFFTDTVNIMLDMFEHTAALGDGDTALCNGNLLSLVNGADEAVDFLWQDGSTDTEILIETAGTYHVTVTNILGCTARDTIAVSILGTVPVPNFTVTGFCAEENIQLNDISTSSDGTINAWEWTYNSSLFSTDQNTNISFDTLGIYPVQLEVFTDVGCHHTITQDIQIHPLPAPAFSPITACAMQNVQFDNLSTIAEGSLSTSQWQFAADGEWISADMQAVQHNFDSDGLFDVSLSVMSEAGCEQIISKTVEVRPSPVADFSASAGCVGEAVYFWNQTDAAGTQLWDYVWEFGDGNTATASDPTYTYNSTGNYNTKLIVKSLNGCTDTIQKTLTVHNLPVAAVSNLYACLGVPHQPEDITGNEAGAIHAWKWEIDTLEFDIENPVITMTEAGEYALSLWVESETGCTSQIDTMLYVWENPVASFELPQTWGAVPLSLTLENNSEQSETWEWHFGDGETSALETPNHVWQDSGNYTVQLVAISPYGCSDTTTLNLRVIIPLVDVAVIAMNSKMDGNYLDVTADIINPGTVPISNLGITLNPGNGEIIREVLPDEFAEGAVLRYHFNAQPYFGSGQLPAYVCVSLDPGVPDDRPDNNQLCDMHEASFSLQAMYPNPVMDMLNLSVLLPQSGDLNVEVFNASGQRVKSLSIDLNSGYHALALDCSDLSSGRYQLRLSFKDQEIVKAFVK